MKFSCEQKEFSTNLALVLRAVSSRVSHPILATIKVESISSDTIQLTGFDLSMGIQCRFAAEIETEGTLALPAKLLHEIVSKLPSGNITVETVKDSNLILISASCGQYQVTGLDHSEFPDLPTIDGESHTLEIINFVDGLTGTLEATSSDESKQILTGVNLNVKENRLEFAATDGHRLGIVYIDSESIGSKNFHTTIPSKALRELDRILGMTEEGELLKLQLEESQVIFQCGKNIKLTTRTLEGKYPDYKLLLPKQFTRRITIDRKLLLETLERIQVISDVTNLVKFSINHKDQSLNISIANETGSGIESLLAQIFGNDLDIAFNIKYFIAGLKILSTQDITISLNGALEPVILAPVGGVDITYLVMPVQLRN